MKDLKLTPNQLALLFDCREEPQWLYPKRTADSLVKKGVCDYRGSQLVITLAGRATLRALQEQET